MKSVLFVCTGNICRSPTAEGIFQNLVIKQGLKSEFLVDSCGTEDWHANAPPDRRSCDIARTNGYDISHLRGRTIHRRDFLDFDIIIGMTKGHIHTLETLKPKDATAQIALFTNVIDDQQGQDVPDPYYGGADGFGNVFLLIETGCMNWLQKLQ